MILEHKSVLKKRREITDELGRLDRMESAAKKQITAAVEDGDIENPKTQRLVADARIRLDMVASRRPKLQADLRALDKDMVPRYRGTLAEWNLKVSNARREAEVARIRAELPFWEGDGRACRRYFDGVRMEEAP